MIHMGWVPAVQLAGCKSIALITEPQLLLQVAKESDVYDYHTGMSR